jgi:glutamate racemase
VAQPIGIFDSGLGGLTVARAVRGTFPAENLVYLGDTARVPYGTRSAGTVVKYAIGCAERLLSFDIKLLVVACNTASGVALGELQARLDIPVVGVIQPGARAGVKATRSGRIGILATAGTVASGAYERAIHSENDAMNVFALPAPLFVPLAEEGWVTGELPELAARRYLQPLADADVDTIVLGCTHYPLRGGPDRDVGRELHRFGASGVAADPGDRSAGPIWRCRLQIPRQTVTGPGYPCNRPVTLRITASSR